MSRQYAYMDSPIGPLLLSGNGTVLEGLYFSTGKKAQGADSSWQRRDAPFAEAKRQLAEYFEGRRKTFELPLAMHGALSPRHRQQRQPDGIWRRTAEQAVSAATGGCAFRSVGSSGGSRGQLMLNVCR